LRTGEGGEASTLRRKAGRRSGSERQRALWAESEGLSFLHGRMAWLSLTTGS